MKKYTIITQPVPDNVDIAPNRHEYRIYLGDKLLAHDMGFIGEESATLKALEELQLIKDN